MKLWTIQHLDAYKQMQKTGYLHANEDHLFCMDDFRFAYDWMSEQMEIRIGDPPQSVSYPIWAWYTWEGVCKRPDIRRAGYAMPGTPIVLLTLEVSPNRVLLSDFDMWHIVMGGHYIALDEKDDEGFIGGVNEIRASWERIFD